jgi:hypothetical protein
MCFYSQKKKTCLKKGRVMNKYNKIYYLLFWGVSTLFLLTPTDALSEPNSEPSSEIKNVTMTPKQIYELLDSKQYDEAIGQAKRLVESQPKNPVAYLALGDALAHYPMDDGDIYAAFDAWIQAKSLSPLNSTNWTFAKERLAWTLERSGVVKLIPSSPKTIRGLNKNMFHKLYTVQEVDIASRTDVMLGGMYFSNVPTGEFILEIKPVPTLPNLVQKYSLVPGKVMRIVIPLNEAEVKSAIQNGHFVWKEKEGQEIIDNFQQPLVASEAPIVEEKNYPLPFIEIPEETKIVLTSPEGETFEYEIGKDVLRGTYSVSVSQNKAEMEGTLIIPDDLSAQSILSMLDSLETEQHKNTREKTQKPPKPPKIKKEEQKSSSSTNDTQKENPKENQNDTQKAPQPSYYASDANLKKAGNQLLGAVVISAGYTLLSNRLASRYAVAANSETQSQEEYETFVSQSEQWEQQQQISAWIMAELASTYFICRTFQKAMSPQKSNNESNQ